MCSIVDPDNPAKATGRSSRQNKRGFNISEYGARNSHKILLLTGTGFINRFYNVENLLAMIDKHPSLEKSI